MKLPVDVWKDKLQNDFEKSIFPQYPEIARIKEKMYEQGAIYSSMSGSGATVFGLFKEKPDQTGFKNILQNKFVYLEVL
jgi:4-diphosphocytidyl-2-C-methyl-D-erythritol kinase